jgi:hypothetical protein
MSSLRFAVVHHTVNSNTYQPQDVPAMLAGMYHYHTASLGWCDLAYNFVVDRFGRVWQGRSGDVTKPIMSGATKGFNTSSLSVSFLGQYEPGASPPVAAPSQASLDAARDLIAWKFAMHGVNPTGTVRVQSAGSNMYPVGTWVTLPTLIGHRDTGHTACPGAYLYSRLPAMRLGVAAVMGGPVGPGPGPGPGPSSPFASHPAMVLQQYRDLLHRSPAPTEILSWSVRLGGAWGDGQFVAFLLASAEADRRVGSVIRLYDAAFRRLPDHPGLTYWLGRHGGGVGLAQISGAFAASAEFRARYGGLSDDGYITRVYQDLFDRLPDSSGRSFWRNRLRPGDTRGAMMASVAESQEYSAKTRSPVLLAAAYEGLLGRTIDPGALWHDTVVLQQGGTLTQVAQGILASGEYHRRF